MEEKVALFKLNDRGEPELCTDEAAWIRWIDSGAHKLAQDRIGCYFVLTQFMGADVYKTGKMFQTVILDHSKPASETMTGYQELTSSVQEALDAHEKARLEAEHLELSTKKQGSGTDGGGNT